MNDEQFFRLCWLTLKKSKPRMRKFMDNIECDIGEALTVSPPKKEGKKDEQSFRPV